VRVELADWDSAKVDFQDALLIDPENKPVKTSLLNLNKRIAQQQQQQAHSFRNIFQ